jgi:cytochrome c-type protein NapB
MRALILTGLALIVAGGIALAQTQGVVSLRGAVELTEINTAPVTLEQSKPANGFGRAYRQQPPLIPHRIESYQVTKAFNKCLSCHGWPQNAQYGAPKVSETHYETREGVRLDEVAGSRWFCNQCHVPQSNAPALVPNAFKNATEIGGAFN